MWHFQGIHIGRMELMEEGKVFPAQCLCLLVRKMFQKGPLLPKQNSPCISSAKAASQARTKPITDKE